MLKTTLNLAMCKNKAEDTLFGFLSIKDDVSVMF